MALSGRWSRSGGRSLNASVPQRAVTGARSLNRLYRLTAARAAARPCAHALSSGLSHGAYRADQAGRLELPITIDCGHGGSPSSVAKTIRLFAGTVMRADVGMPCLDGPSAMIPPALPWTAGFGKVS